MSRNWRLYLLDILECCEKILKYTEGCDLAAFQADDLKYDAVLRNLTIIGEASKSIPHEVRVRHPEIDWKRLAGLRDVLAHAYFGVDDAVVWDVITTKIPALRDRLRRILRA